MQNKGILVFDQFLMLDQKHFQSAYFESSEFQQGMVMTRARTFQFTNYFPVIDVLALQASQKKFSNN